MENKFKEVEGKTKEHEEFERINDIHRDKGEHYFFSKITPSPCEGTPSAEQNVGMLILSDFSKIDCMLLAKMIFFNLPPELQIVFAKLILVEVSKPKDSAVAGVKKDADAAPEAKQ